MAPFEPLIEFARILPQRTLCGRRLVGVGVTEAHMKIADIMSSDVQTVSPDDTVQAAAQKMEDADIGFLPVGEDDTLVGMVTDRDIALRVAAKGKDPTKTKVRDVMTKKVLYCSEAEDVTDAVESMAELRIRRLPIVDRYKRLVGVVSLGDVAFRHEPSLAGAALESVCNPIGEAYPAT
jgi:CBS domain-containing protein